VGEISILKSLVEKTQANLKTVLVEKKIDSDSRPVYDAISFEPVHIDYLSSILKIPVEKLSIIMLNLLMDGLIVELPGKMYIKKG
jgi:predicted Rossmann fold nucleotide-binding protein DprA/Smf involved in DNA uptake